MKPIPAIGKQIQVKGWGLASAPAVTTTGAHFHKTFREWAEWLRHQSLTR